MHFEFGTKNEQYNADTLKDVVKFSFITGLIDTNGHNIAYNFQLRIDKYTTFNNRLHETESLQLKACSIQMDHHR